MVLSPRKIIAFFLTIEVTINSWTQITGAGLSLLGIQTGLICCAADVPPQNTEHEEAAAAAGTPDWSSELPAKELYSRSCALTDGYSGRLLYGKEESEARANASTTKILTCILFLELGDVQDTVTATERAARQPKVRLGMKVGGTYRAQDLLYCLMLESYNDCAVALAEHIAGSVEEFAELMNHKAEEIGCRDTYFITPNGLDYENENGFHHTTAEDLCRIMRYCVWESPKSAEFLEITQTASYQFKDGQGGSHSINNHNRLLASMDGAISGKTGFTSDAGYCYVMAYEKDGKRFCASFLGCGWPNNRNYKWKDAAKLIHFAEEYYRKEDLYQTPQIVPLTVPGSHPENPKLSDWGESVALKPQLLVSGNEQRMPYMISDKDTASARLQYENVQAPIARNDPVGMYEISLNNEVIRQYPLVADTSAQTWSFGDIFSVVADEFVRGVHS